VLLGLAMVLAGACAPAPHDREITSATPIGDVFAPRFAVDAADTFIERFDPPGAGAGLALALTTTVQNPNTFAIVVERIDYQLALAGEPVAHGSLPTDLPLEANGSDTLRWTLQGELGERPLLWSQVVAAFAGEPLPFTVHGRVAFSSQTFAFTTGSRLLVDGTVLSRESVQPPRLRLERIGSRVTLVRPDAPVVTLTLMTHNPGDVGYFLTGRGLVLELNGVAVAVLDLGPVPVPAGDTVRSELTFLIDPARLDDRARAALEEALSGERGDVRLLGELAYDVLGVDSFPVDTAGGLTLSLPTVALPSPP
jgi:hypothetical protein